MFPCSFSATTRKMAVEQYFFFIFFYYFVIHKETISICSVVSVTFLSHLNVYIFFFFLYARNWKCDYFAFYDINYTGCNTHKTTKSHYKTQIKLYLSCPSSKNTFWSTTSHDSGEMQKRRFQTNIIARIIILWFLDFANDQNSKQTRYRVK